MMGWLARLWIVWMALIFEASANEEILHGGQQLAAEASNQAASATTTGHAAFPPVECESRTADNAPKTGKKARLQADESDDDLLTIRLGTRGAYPSCPSSFGQPSRFRVFSVMAEKPIHLTNNNHHQLFPSGVSLEQVNSQASSSTTRRDSLSDFDKTRKMDSSASSTEHYIPLPTNPPESLSESFNLGRKTQLQIDQAPFGNSVTHNQDGGRGTKRKNSNSWGYLLSLKTGVTSDENDTQHSYATPNFLSGSTLEKPNRFSAKENCIAAPQFNPQEIQQVTCLNAGASTAPMLSADGTIPQQLSSMAGQNGGNFLLSRENAQSWGAEQGATSSPGSQPKHSIRAEKHILVDWPRSTEPFLKKHTRPQQNSFQSGNQGSSSENPGHIPQVSKMPKPHQPEAIIAIRNHPSQIDSKTNCKRLKFNTDLFRGKGPYQLERSRIVMLLGPMPKLSLWSYFFSEDQLDAACVYLKKKHFNISTPSMTEIGKFMGNIDRWYQYWTTHANIELDSLRAGEKVLECRFAFPVFLLYVEMIHSIIPVKQEQKLDGDLDYSQKMKNAIQSFLDFNIIMKAPPENGDAEIWMENHKIFKQTIYRATQRPAQVVWTFIEYWMKSHYTALWNKIVERNGFHVCVAVKAFFNSIFTLGIETLNEKLKFYLPHE